MHMNTWVRRCAAFMAAVSITVTCGKLSVYTTGNPADVASTLTLGGPVLDLGGGNWDVIDAFQSAIDKVRGCTGATCATKIDVVIIRADGADGYNSYLYAFNGVDSVQTFVIPTAKDITAEVVTAVRNAEFIFFAGGDQCNYCLLYKGTALETAVEYAYSRGAAIGGTSAGEAIMGPFIYNACLGTVTSPQALGNPYDRSITFTFDFFNFAHMEHTITDQHFVARDRMGRLLTFMARLLKDGKTDGHVWGIAVNEETSVVVDKLGMGTVVQNYGGNPLDPTCPASTNAVAYYILADHMPTTCVSKTPLSYTGYKVWKRTVGQTFNMALASRPTTSPDYTINVVNGVMTAVGNNGNIY